MAQLDQPARLGRRPPDNTALDIHADDPAFGYRFIADGLRERGLTIGGNRFARSCSQQRIWWVIA